MLPHPWPRYFPVSAVAHCTKHQAWQRIRKREKRSKWCSLKVVAQYSSHTIASWGTWCSGITSASHAEGPGFKSQCVHLSRLVCVNCSCVPSATASPRAFFAGFQCVASPLATFVIFQLGQRRSALNIRFGSGFANWKKEVNCALSKL